MRVVAEQCFDLKSCDRKIRARLYQPVVEPDSYTWSCRVEVDPPLYSPTEARGVSSLQALELGLKLLSISVYSSEAYRRKELGVDGRFGGDLGIPAVAVFLDIAPYPF